MKSGIPKCPVYCRAIVCPGKLVCPNVWHSIMKKKKRRKHTFIGWVESEQEIIILFPDSYN